MSDDMVSKEELGERLLRLAERALDECRLNLMMSFRFFNAALWQMPYEPADLDAPTGTDGARLLFDPARVVRAYRDSPSELTRDYLHTILHCVFRQPFRTLRSDSGMWSRACDICVESIAIEMCGERFPSVFDGARRDALARIAGDVGTITPMKVYRRILETREDPHALDYSTVTYEVLCDEAGLFERDDHSRWNLSGSGVLAGEEGGSSDEEGDADGSQESASGEGAGEQADDDRPQDEKAPENRGGEPSEDEGEEEDGVPEPSDSGKDDGEPKDGGQAPQRGDSSDDGSNGQGGTTGDGGQDGLGPSSDYEEGELPEDEAERAREAWERISREVQTDLETMSKQRGDGLGNLVSNLELANRSQVDYADFLRRFSKMAEDMVLNDEEFDYIFYTYGLKRYGNMPLIEPLEYKETDRVREFVIVLDTSGSCSGELIRTFVTRTYEILHDSRQFDEKVNVHIIQCDAEVQSDDKITSIEELRSFERGFEVRGMGGTDFRPAFAYVDELLAKSEFEDLRGLIYFTDGWGVFPKRKPAYESAFVFVEEDGRTRRVPPWAMRVVLTQEDIEELPAGHANGN